MTQEWFFANIPFEASEQQLRDFITANAPEVLVSRTRIITDHDTGRSKGFGFADVDVSGGEAELEEARRKLFGKQLEAGGKSLPIHVEASKNPRRRSGDPYASMSRHRD